MTNKPDRTEADQVLIGLIGKMQNHSRQYNADQVLDAILSLGPSDFMSDLRTQDEMNGFVRLLRWIEPYIE
jgi:hypothetical protein